ncbi:hypothetical protein BJX99DRAFT_234111 [Aspergillus californicus]
MPLTIDLYDPQPCYYGDERITGRVIFQTTTPVDINEIRVTFSGTAKAKIQKVKGSGAPAANYRSKCLLFETGRTLWEKDDEPLSPGTYECPFDFVFPTHVQPSAMSKWPEQAPFRNDESHPLPPTFALEAADATRKLDCFVDYRLEAQVFKPQRGFMGSKAPLYSEVMTFNFMPSLAASNIAEDEPGNVTYRQQKEQLFTVRSKMLLMENKGRSLNLQERLHSWLLPSQLPRFSYKVLFTYPTRFTQAVPVVCSLDVTPFMEDSSVSLPPDILLQAVSLTIVSRTAARATPSLMGSMSAEIDERIEILSRRSLRKPVLGTMDLGDVFGPLTLRHTDISFGTFNIARTYRLCSSFVFECAGKTDELVLPDLPIDLIARSRDLSRDVSRDVKEEEVTGEAAQFPVQEALPCYTPTSPSSVSTHVVEKM